MTQGAARAARGFACIAALALAVGGCRGRRSEGASGSASSAAAFDSASWRTLLPPSLRFDDDVSALPAAPTSAATIAAVAAAGGWGHWGSFQIDTTIEVLFAAPSTPRVSWSPTKDWFEPDCDRDDVPLPAGGALEGEKGYACTGDGDCHLLVVDPAARRLYEQWRADLKAPPRRGGCLAVWDLARDYGPSGRGEGCTSADAAGLPIAPLLAEADEVAAGHIDHALRFVLPNDRIRRRAYVHPATHSTDATQGGPDTPPLGARLRLRADYPLAKLPSDGGRVLARALQRYGMFLADGGQSTLTVRSDSTSHTTWEGRVRPIDLEPLRVEDFEVLPSEPPRTFTGACTRTR